MQLPIKPNGALSDMCESFMGKRLSVDGEASTRRKKVHCPKTAEPNHKATTKEGLASRGGGGEQRLPLPLCQPATLELCKRRGFDQDESQG